MIEKKDYDKIVHSQLENIAIIDYGIRKVNEKVKLEIIEGQDYHFSKDTFDFKQLPEKFLLN